MIKKYQFFLLTLAILIGSSGCAFAADLATDKISFFNPPTTDKSLSYLGQLFGTVGTVLHGNSGELLAKIFEIFNLGILSIACVFAAYTVLKSVLATAQDGEFMGKQGKSTFVAVRTCLGVGFLAPVFGGYSAIQVVMMWVVVHGVGFADAVWAKALTYIKNNGQIYTPPPQKETEDSKNTLNNSAYVLRALVCSQSSKKMADKINQDINDAKEKGQSTTLLPQNNSYQPDFGSSTDTTKSSFNFPGGVETKGGNTYGSDKCGSITFKKGIDSAWNITWESTADDKKTIPPYITTFYFRQAVTSRKGCEDAYLAVNKKINDEKWPLTPDRKKIIDDAYQTCLNMQSKETEDTNRAAITQMAMTLSPIAKGLVESEFLDLVPNTDENSGANPTQINNIMNNKVVAGLIGASADFLNITLPLRTTTDPVSEQNFKKYFNESARNGWITAGSLYYDLGRIQRKIMDKNNDLFIGSGAIPSQAADFQNKLGFTFPDITNRAVTLMKNVGGSAEAAKNNYLDAAKLAAKLIQNANAQDNPDYTRAINSITNNSGQESFDKLIPSGRTIFTLWRDFSNGNGDPILGLQNLGSLNMNVAAGAYLGSLAVVGIASFLSLMVTGSGNPAIGTVLFMAVFPVFMLFVTTLFATGATMAFYLPLIPYLLFIFGAVGWIITVLESMVAAPLVALGVTHPEGHDLLGKSEQAIMLMLGVFLKPALMIVGLIGGMILSRIGIRMISSGFNSISESILLFYAKSLNFLVVIFGQLILEIIFVSIVIGIINQAYSLIYHIPDKVLRWIGAPEMGTGKPEALHKIEQTTTEAGKEIGSGIGKGAQHIGKLLKDTGKSKKPPAGEPGGGFET